MARKAIIGGKEIELRANTLALLYYRQEFDRDLIGDIMKMQELQDGDLTKFDSVLILQVAYALNRASASPYAKFPTFFDWVIQFENIDFTDEEWILNIVHESMDGFFRSGSSSPEQKSGTGKKK